MLDSVPRGKDENYDTEEFRRGVLAKAPAGTRVEIEMTKFIALTRKDPRKTDHANFLMHWKDPHMPNVIKGWQPRRYIVTHFDEDPAAALPPVISAPPFDGMAVMWFKDFAEYMSLAKVYMTTAGASDPLALRTEVIVIFASREYVIMDGPREGFKITYLIRAKPNVPLQKFYDHWLSVHALDTKWAVERACPGKQVRVSMNVALEQARTSTPVEGLEGEWKSGKGIDWAGVKEMWFPDRESRETFLKFTSGPPQDMVWEGTRETGGIFTGTEVVGIP